MSGSNTGLIVTIIVTSIFIQRLTFACSIADQEFPLCDPLKSYSHCYFIIFKSAIQQVINEENLSMIKFFRCLKMMLKQTSPDLILKRSECARDFPEAFFYRLQCRPPGFEKLAPA